MFSLVSIVGKAQEPSSTAAAACRNWPVVRGNSTSARRGAFGSAVSAWAASTNSALRALRAARQTASEIVQFVPAARPEVSAASAAASSAASQSAQELMGNSSGSISPVAGFSARKEPLALAARHSPAMRTG